ncbi:unnamed protein product [Alternaria alternata]
MKDPACVVLVAEDVIDEDESEHVYDAIRESFKSVALRRRGIVGVCSIQLKPESAYTHQFQPPEMLANLNERLSAHDLERDQSIEAANIYDADLGSIRYALWCHGGLESRISGTGLRPLHTLDDDPKGATGQSVYCWF